MTTENGTSRALKEEPPRHLGREARATAMLYSKYGNNNNKKQTKTMEKQKDEVF